MAFQHVQPFNSSLSDVQEIRDGSTNINDTEFIRNVTIPSVVLNKSVLLFSYKYGSGIEEARDEFVTGQITSTTNLKFERTDNEDIIEIEWSMIIYKLSSPCIVQRGSLVPTLTTENITINAVNLANAFPIISIQGTGIILNSNDFWSANITTTTNLQLQVVIFKVTTTIEWQVVNHPLYSVTRYMDTLPTSLMFKDTTIAPITLGKTWLIGTASANLSGGPHGRNIPWIYFLNNTTIRAARFGSVRAFDLIYYVVEGNDLFRTFDSLFTIPNGDDDQNITISPIVNELHSLVTMGSIQVCMCGSSIPSEEGDNLRVKAKMNSNKRCSVKKVAILGETSGSVQVLDFTNSI